MPRNLSLVELKPGEAKNALRHRDALRVGHFIGTQGEVKGLGWHLTTYVDKVRALMHPDTAATLARGIAYKVSFQSPKAIVAPPVGAICLGMLVAQTLKIPLVYPDRAKDGTLSIAREPFLEIMRGERVAVVEDCVNSGKTMTETIEAVWAAGGIPTTASAIWSRAGLTPAQIGVEVFVPLINEQLPHWDPDACKVNGPCSKDVPIDRTPGHGAALEQLPEGQGLKFR